MTKIAAGALGVAALLRLTPAQSPTIVGVEQRDEWRSPADRRSVVVSADGRYVAFASYARLAAADTNNSRDVYVLDRLDGRVTLESVAADGRATAADSAHPHLSGDGRFLVYETLTGALGDFEVVLRDRVEGSSRVLSRDASTGTPAGSWSGYAAIGAGGRHVAFVSTKSLTSGDDRNGTNRDVYVYNIADGILRRASVDSDEAQPRDGASTDPSLSADGRYVTFASTAPLAAAAPRASAARGRLLSDVYVRDMQSGTTALVSVEPHGRPAGAASWGPAISDDGRYIAFVSAADTLVRGDRNRCADVFVADRRTGAIELVSRSANGGSANGRSGAPSLSADGRFVVFQSEASNLVCAKECGAHREDINLLPDVFLFDRQSGKTTRVSTDPASGWMEASAGPAIDGSGEVIAFSSQHPIDGADRKHDFDLFVRAAPFSAARTGRAPRRRRRRMPPRAPSHRSPARRSRARSWRRATAGPARSAAAFRRIPRRRSSGALPSAGAVIIARCADLPFRAASSIIRLTTLLPSAVRSPAAGRFHALMATPPSTDRAR